VLVRPDDGAVYDARIAFEPSGAAVAIWSRAATMGTIIETARFVPGPGWGPHETLASNVITLGPSLFSGPGAIIAAWTTGATMRMSRYSAGAWGPAEEIGAGVGPQLVIGAGGALVAAYAAPLGSPDDDDDRERVEVHARRYHPTTGWSPPRRLDNYTGHDEAPNHIVIAGRAGGAIAVWEQHHWHSGSAFRAYAATVP
jgi:hypothetical protein